MKSKKFLPFFLFFTGLFAQDRILTINDATERVLTVSPTLKIQSATIKEKYGEHVQLGLYPNPIFSYSVENVFGFHHWRGWRSAESRYEYAQLFEIGGKRQFRSEMSKYDYFAAQANYEVAKIDVLNQMSKIFINVISAQEALNVIEEQKKIAQEILNTVLGKVESGKVSEIQQNKAEITLSGLEIIAEEAESNYFSAKENLATTWGSEESDFDYLEYPFFEIQPPVMYEICLQELEGHPLLLKNEFEFLAAQQEYRLEKSGKIPDITFVIGYKTLNETNDQGMVLGAALPLPIYNLNQGNIQRARAKISFTDQKHKEARILLVNKLKIAYNELMTAYNTVIKLRDHTLKKAENAFNLARVGYNEGKFEYLEMLDSQRTFFEVREKYIDALRNYHHKQMDVLYLNIKADS